MSIDRNDIEQVIGQDVHGADGEKIGSVGQVYLDDQTGRPDWVTVKTGLFGTRSTFVPLEQAQRTEDGLRVPYTKDQVKDAPNIEDEGHLEPAEEERLFAHYGLAGGAAGTPAAGRAGEGTLDEDVVGHETSGPTTGDAMTRSEEQLHVGTERRETGRARLRKYVVTEEQQTTVPVSREEVRVEREPITDANRGDALDGPSISEEEHEVTLHEERPVVEKETVPVERVRLEKDTVTSEEQVGDTVRKERIETEGVDDVPDDRRA
ncbi:DUF2382 domain-containing protein [Janibacter anophelis]|uniref:DUF2382 domain-containing protein n=1 Tax=Janibacter anophelis TaxID=319054 RepID=UPI000DEEE565|nr:PRC and DUF2382 domain-containing protein [Janibacter anophelis]